jgi:hypothetical protein
MAKLNDIHVTLHVDVIVKAMGEDADDFLEIMRIVDDIIVSPDKYSGIKALMLANQLAAYRTKIGIKANWLKSQERSISNRQRKDVLLSLEHNLEENINCLKLMGRIEGKAAGLL